MTVDLDELWHDVLEDLTEAGFRDVILHASRDQVEELAFVVRAGLQRRAQLRYQGLRPPYVIGTRS